MMLLCRFLLFIAPALAFSQYENALWYFGSKAGLGFLSNPPAPVAGSSITAWEASTTIASASGNLLFYSSGDTVWNKQHQMMANGAGLLGHKSAAQGMVIKKPGSGTLYYLFTLDYGAGNNGLRYSVIDMSLAAGNGSVTLKNVLLHAPAAEQVAAVKHCNGTDYWLISHELGTNVFRSYLITASGVSASPVTAAVGLPWVYFASQMKINRCGNRLAVPMRPGTSGATKLALYNFNNSSGLVNNEVLLDTTLVSAYGVEFSSDCSKLYAQEGAGPPSVYRLIQYDLCQGSGTAIATSAISWSVPVRIAGMQLGPNGKIYIASYLQGFLSVIEKPEQPWPLCQFSQFSQSIAGQAVLSLPSFVASDFKPSLSTQQALGCKTVTFTPPAFANSSMPGCSLNSHSVTSLIWTFGDPGSGPANTSTVNMPVHTYSANGSYSVSLVINYAFCAADTIRQVIAVGDPTLTVVTASASCSGLATATVFAVGGTGNYTYSWSPGISTSSVAAGLSPGNQTIVINDAPGCGVTVTAAISAPALISAGITTTAHCGSVSAFATMSNGSGQYQYQWLSSTHTTNPAQLPAGTYTLQVHDLYFNCIITQTANAAGLTVPTLSASSPGSICAGQAATLQATGASVYQWQGGPSSSGYVVSPTVSTVYSVTGTLSASGCSSTHSVQLIVDKCQDIPEIEKQSFMVYPNPASGQLTIESGFAGMISIWSVDGRMLRQQQINAGLNNLDLRALDEGIYLLRTVNAGVQVKLVVAEQ